MRGKKGFIIAAAVAVISMVHPTSVYADGGGTVLIESKEVKTGETQIQTSCIVSGDVYATNGKLRITYDPQQMVLKEAAAGEALGGSTIQINDPVNGNKEEGEIVFVFAAAQSFKLEGSMLDMVFSSGSDFQAGNDARIQVDVEELDNESTKVEVSAQEGRITAETENTQTPDTDSPGTNNPDTGSPDGSNAGKDNIEKGEPGGENKNLNGTHKVTEGQKKSGGNTTKTSAGSSGSTKAKNVKTGDDIEVFGFIEAGITSVVIIGALLGIKKRRTKS